MNFKKIFTISMSMLVILQAWSQGKVPVNHYTGTAYINVPIGTVRDKDLAERVSLSYATSGIKVEQQAGILGLGWSLSAGGSISRELRGLPDDLNTVVTLEDTRLGWLESNNHSDAGSFTNTTNQTEGECDGEETTWSNLNTLSNNFKDDTEPDIFHFNFGGYSGKFLFDNSGSIKTVPYHDFKIEYVRGTKDLIENFTITTENGTVYKFNTYEYVGVRSFIQHPIADVAGDPVQFFHKDFITYEPFLVEYHTAWHLSEIISPVTDAQITFEYINSSVQYDEPVELMVAENDSNYEPVKQLFYFKRYNHDRKVLSKIKTSFQSEIEFTYSLPGNDEFRRQLDAITVYNGESGSRVLVRQFDMIYESLGITYKDDISYDRKYLKTVQEKSGTSTLPPYAFEYFGVEWGNNIALLPLQADDGAVDFWGYYNGVTQDLEGPSLYVYPDESTSKRYRTYPLTSFTGSEYILKGADRKPRNKYATAGTLNRVTWPSGGQTLLFYETHQYRDNDENANQYGGGIRLSMQVLYDGISHDNDITLQYEYNQSNGNSSGHLVYPSVFAVPSNVYEDFATNILFFATTLGPWSETNYNKMVSRSIYNLAGNELSFGSTVVYERVKVELEGSGSTVYEYKTPALYNSQTEDSGAWQAALTSLALNKAPGTDMNGNPFCHWRGYYPKGAYAFPYTQNPFYDYKRGLLEKVTDFQENGNKVRSQEYTYGTVNDQIANVQGINYEVDRYEPNGSYAKFFQFTAYNIRTQENSVLQQVKETVYSDAGQTRTLVKTSNYEYSSSDHTYLTKSSSTNSDGTVYATHYLYPEDLNLTGTLSGSEILAVKNMVDNHRYNMPLEVRSTVNNVTSGASLNIFKIDNSVARLDSVLEFRTESPASFNVLTTEVNAGVRELKRESGYSGVSKVLEFNSSGLISTVSSLIGKNTSTTIYGYENQLPIANVANAEPDHILYSSFDNDSEHNFALDDNSGLNPDAYSGSQSVHFTTAGTNSLSGTVTQKGTSYYVTFFAKAASTETVTVDFNLTQVGSVSIANTSGGWKFYRIAINPANWTFGSSFGVKINGSDGLKIDQVTFYPADARVSTVAYDPRYGVTSQTNPKGHTIFNEYDVHGRLVRQRDLDGNIIQQSTYETMVNQN